MPLSIGVGVGSKIGVGQHTVSVRALVHPRLIVIAVDNGPDIVVTDRESVEILPEVKVQTGVGASGGSNRLAFTAPREIRISRL